VRALRRMRPAAAAAVFVAAEGTPVSIQQYVRWLTLLYAPIDTIGMQHIMVLTAVLC
jgi:hypothetical protein